MKIRPILGEKGRRLNNEGRHSNMFMIVYMMFDYDQPNYEEGV